MEESWSVPDVYLLTEGPEGTVAVPHLALTFGQGGLALDKADGGEVWGSRWDDLEEMAPVARYELPDGRPGVVIVVVERGDGTPQQHRFVLATDQPAETEASIRGSAATHGLRTNRRRPAVSKALTALIVLAVLATTSLLLLSAAHVLHL
jgi:hypothetical protein